MSQTGMRIVVLRIVLGIVSPMLFLASGCASARQACSGRLADVGRIFYTEWKDGRALVRVKKDDGLVIDIHYEAGEAIDRIIIHPKGHPLQQKVAPQPDGRTLHSATELLPKLINIAKGKKEFITDELAALLDDYPEHLCDAPFEQTPGCYRLTEGDMLFIKGYTFEPYARNPVVAYWGPTRADGLGDELLYCGFWELDKTSLNLPLEFPPGSLHIIGHGDTVEFMGCNLHVEFIDHDNDGIRENNVLILRVEGLSDYSQVEESAGVGRPVTPEEFVREVCFPVSPDLSLIRTHQGPLSVSDIEEEITSLAYAETNSERGGAVKKMLIEMGYDNDQIKSAGNRVGMEDIWVVKPGESRETAIIATYYDKIGEGSQGVIDNAVGVVVTAGAAKALRQRETKLTYALLFFGGEEIGHNWGWWLLNESNLKDPIRYVVSVKGYGLRGCERTLHLKRRTLRGWLYWSFPVLSINSTGGDPEYQKHTAQDNLSFCDFGLVKEAQDSLVDWIIAIEENL